MNNAAQCELAKECPRDCEWPHPWDTSHTGLQPVPRPGAGITWHHMASHGITGVGLCSPPFGIPLAAGSGGLLVATGWLTSLLLGHACLFPYLITI